MGLMEQAQADVRAITSDKTTGFGKTMTITKKNGSFSATIVGIHSKIRTLVDTAGNEINAKKAHVSFSESLLTDQGYVTRGADLEIDMIGDKVDVVDSTGSLWRYVIREHYPDETVGLIVCLLGDFE
jgi:hypothetical protein